jgi:PAS domain S-box-containing protein
LGADVKILANPLVLRMALGLFAALFAFAMGVLLMRRMRQSLTEEQELLQEPARPATEAFPLATYHAVIQQLKQQKHELTAQQAAERRRARVSENISAAVLSNLSSGVLFFSTQGLLRQANHAAKQILGFASPVGMNAGELFRDTGVHNASTSERWTVAEAIQSTLKSRVPLRQLEARYFTPSGEERYLELTISPVPGSDGTLLGAACLINDQTPMAQIRSQQEMRGEMSAEMALALRSSLVTISGYAQQLAQNRDPDVARQLADDIAAEAAHLDRSIGGFLAAAKTAKAGSERL